MTFVSFTAATGIVERVREFFKPKEVFFHDGKAMRRVALSTRTQVLAAAGLALCATSGIAGAAGVAISAPAVSSTLTNYAEQSAAVSAMETRVASLQAEVATIRKDARTHAERLEKRQAFLASVLAGKGDAKTLATLLPSDAGTSPQSADIAAAFAPVAAKQSVIAGKLLAATENEYRMKAGVVAKLGINPQRLSLAMGGPYEPVPADYKAPTAEKTDAQFRALFNSWKRLDQLEQAMVAIPSAKPVATAISLTSGFGVRSDPFRGGAAMHSGVDIPGPVGTPIYATADGIIGRTGWVGGYGNLVEIDHGKGIQTRYGHLSASRAVAGTRVKRGDLIGLMGSTGRSTGSHLHYEVRLDGRAVNPTPFLRTDGYLLAMERRAAGNVALGGPGKAE
jgi:murein DD-endopeptidase MepM/ murein hydrolase activator NlpD